LRRYPQIVAWAGPAPAKYVAPLLRRMRDRTMSRSSYPNSGEFYGASSSMARRPPARSSSARGGAPLDAEGARLMRAAAAPFRTTFAA